jgi:autotransporter-associated beta strand protein
MIADAGTASPIGTAGNVTGVPSLFLGVDGSRDIRSLTGTNGAYSTDRRVSPSGTYPNGGAVGVQNSGTEPHVYGQLTGSGSFIKTGPGTRNLGKATNNYTGGAYIETGTLYTDSSGATPPTAT